MALEPMKPRSTRYLRLLLGPRKPSLEEERNEDDGRMNDRDVKDGWLDGWRRGSRVELRLQRPEGRRKPRHSAGGCTLEWEGLKVLPE